MSAPSAESGAKTSPGGPGDPGRVAAAGLSLSPFRGLRYVPERVGTLAAVTSPPYDVVDPHRRLGLETADPHNVVRLILPRPEPEDTGERSDRDTRYRHAARLLKKWVREGVLAADPQPALYVYEQRTSDDSPGGELLQRGLIGALAVSGREGGVVLPHEDVMPRPVADRVGLMRTTRANLEPLLLTYRGGGGAAGVIERTVEREPLLTTTTSDGTHHRLWAVTDPAELAEVTRDLATCRALIADGHHRWEMYLRLQREHRHLPFSPWDRGMVLLVDTARYPLRVRAIHRVLYRLPLQRALAALDEGGWSVRQLAGPLEQALAALTEAKQSGGNAFLLTAGDGGYHLLTGPDEALLNATVPKDRPEEWRRLDATVLHATLLEHTWRVPDGPDDIGYLHAAAAAEREAARTGGTAVLLHPVDEGVVRRLAEQGVTMPRKSTSFGPKPASGLVLRSLELG
ncbi:uncharacterized protein (DUF1015 family) [Kitasatospora sp. MAP12-9]|uniref:DUF1015 domain-containing protein n=1 Tax=unclassified Kitasatospora TaxID=2633591 RepID=UPI0024762469|nr:DUF1015 domain-containing protein [Kitasatospora sp. MAP12-44]MDH6113529.1 uncharacterized protein (DUF1015 family) [Kitasatospora sp. MAP12-44]